MKAELKCSNVAILSDE